MKLKANETFLKSYKPMKTYQKNLCSINLCTIGFLVNVEFREFKNEIIVFSLYKYSV
jgi:hypothetical protein